jgi:hypothetical protein
MEFPKRSENIPKSVGNTGILSNFMVAIMVAIKKADATLLNKRNTRIRMMEPNEQKGSIQFGRTV